MLKIENLAVEPLKIWQLMLKPNTESNNVWLNRWTMWKHCDEVNVKDAPPKFRILGVIFPPSLVSFTNSTRSFKRKNDYLYKLHYIFNMFYHGGAKFDSWQNSWQASRLTDLQCASVDQGIRSRLTKKSKYPQKFSYLVWDKLLLYCETNSDPHCRLYA